jgi:hypothetical protein
MKKDVQVLKGVNFLMIITFLNADLEMNGEADSKNQIYKNNKDYFNRQGHLALPFYYYPTFDICSYVGLYCQVLLLKA